MQTFRQFAFGTIAACLFMASSSMPSFADDPPSRVARLKYISGDVSMQPGGVDDWATATINRPMTTADRLWTDRDSRAELHLGSAAMRMNSETSLTLTNLTNNTVQLELDQGTLNLHVARLHDHEIYEVDTPNMAFTLLKSGDYRFDVDSKGDVTEVTVWKGKGVATGNGDAVRVESRHQVRFFDGMSLAHQSYNAPRFDGFDEWCRVRSDREGHSISVRYVSPDVIGYEDLDEYGAWRETGTYGGVWFPTRVDVGWAPYRYGHWAWVDPWGWTWIDDAAWGFAPFHYGRWVFVTGRWGWVPGPVSVRPCYAPALVAWIGGSGVGVGWFPLGYGEPYIPYYHVSRNYFQTVNVSNTRITNITYVTNNYYNVNNVHINNVRYVNQTTATTIVNNDVIVNSRRIDHNVFIDHDRDRNDSHDRWVTNGPQVPPSHDSVLGGHRDDRAAVPPERIMNKRVVMNLPPPERPVPFDTKRADLDDHRGRPLDQDEEDRLRQRIAQGQDDGNDHGRSASAGGGHYPAPRQTNQNPDAARDRTDKGQGRLNGPDWRESHQDNASAGRQVPRPPSRNDNAGDDHGQATSAGSYNPAPKQREQNPSVNDGERNSYRRGAQRNNPNWDGSQRDDASAARQVPRPPSRNDNAGDDHGQGTSAGGYNPAPKQREQNPSVNDGERNSYGTGPQRDNPNWDGNQRGDASAARQVPHSPSRNDNGGDDHAQATSPGGYNPAPKQREENPRVNNGERTAPPSYADRGAGSQLQQDHTMMRQAQVDHSSDAHPAQPAPRMAESQRATESAHAPQPESHPAPSNDSGSNGNSHGSSQFQEHSHGKQDPDPK